MTRTVAVEVIANIDPAPAAPRLAWIDNLRTLMIVLVVNLHACVTFSHVGDWYRVEDPEPGMPVKIAFLFWQAHVQAFFMGLLFFIAGVFAHRSLQRRGSWSFVRERGRRLGLPSLSFMLCVQPFIVYLLLGSQAGPDGPSLANLYGGYLLSGRVLSGNGPMWFALALLLFCVVLAGMRALRPLRSEMGDRPSVAPGAAALMTFAAVLVLGTFLVRTVQPLGTNVLNFQLGYFTQYVAAFIVGVAAGRRGWLEELVTSRGARVAGWLGVLCGPLLLALVAGLGGPPPENAPNPYEGGWNVRAFAYAAWEQTTGLALALGMLSWFRRHGRSQGRFLKWLSDRAFAVYVLHAPVLVALTPLVRPAAIHPFVGTALLTLTGVGASFIAADLARRLPGLRRIL
jgi:fucose 4-O-acetylase-like acetyltransferase